MQEDHELPHSLRHIVEADAVHVGKGVLPRFVGHDV